jgi:hypothetical protein
MARAAWIAGVVATVAVAGLALAAGFAEDGTVAGESPGDPVLAEPRHGDAGTIVADESETEAKHRVHVAWTRPKVPLPDGERQAMPTLSYTQPAGASASEGADAGGEARTEAPVETLPAVVRPGAGPASAAAASDAGDEGQRYAAHAAELPGAVVARSFHVDHQAEVGEGAGASDVETTWSSTSLVDEADRCKAPLPVRLAGLPAEKARQHLADCAQQRLDEVDQGTSSVTVEAGWSTGEDGERLWIAHVNRTSEGPDKRLEHTRRIVTSPAASLLLEETRRTEGQVDGETVDRATVRNLEGFERGDEVLEDGAAPGPAPTVPTVEWTRAGPAEGDLAAGPLEDATAAVERTPEGLRFFQRAEDPRIASARFVDEDRSVEGTVAFTSSNGARCQPEDATELPEDAGRRAWSVFWTSEDEGRLWGRTSEPRAVRETPLGDQVPVLRATATHFEGDEPWPPFGERPGLQGPSLQALWEHRGLVDGFQDEGARMLEVDGQEADAALTGSVGRVDCVQQAGGDRHVTEEARVVFEEGAAQRVIEAVSVWGDASDP